MQKLSHKTTIRSIVMVGALLALSACSTKPMPTMAQFEPQYCHTKSKHTLQNGDTASSRVDVNCTDDPKDKHFLAYSGMAKDCREHYYEINLNGKRIRQRGFVCQKLNGAWEIVNHPYN
jgi:hypothetical protein